MKKIFTHVIIIAAAAAFALCTLPLISAHSGGAESGTLIVRGYNLMEFSAWGCISLFAPLFIPGILLGNQSRSAQEVELAILFLGNAVCFVHSFNAAREWLASNGVSLITCHPGMLLYPIAFIAVFLLGKVYDEFSNRNGIPNEDEMVIFDE